MEDELQESTVGEDGLPSQETPPEPSADERLAALQAEIEEERQANAQRIADLETRYRDTSSWANTANMRALAAERQLVALAPVQQQQRPDLKAPSLSEEELERLTDDPKLIWKTIQDAVDYGSRFTMSRIEPYLQMVPALATINENQAELLREVAVDRARVRAVGAGVPAEEFDGYLQEAWHYMNAAAKGDPIELRKMETNPAVVLHAVQMARTQNGVPVVKPPVNPTIGVRSGNGGRPAAAPTRTETVSDMEATFGTKFNDDDLKRAKDREKDLARLWAR
jgi:hypothetical protein